MSDVQTDLTDEDLQRDIAVLEPKKGLPCYNNDYKPWKIRSSYAFANNSPLFISLTGLSSKNQSHWFRDNTVRKNIQYSVWLYRVDLEEKTIQPLIVRKNGQYFSKQIIVYCDNVRIKISQSIKIKCVCLLTKWRFVQKLSHFDRIKKNCAADSHRAQCVKF